MALPRIIAMTCTRKELWVDGNVMLVFEAKTTEDEGKGGYAKLLVSAAVAADFALNTEYTWTATVGD